MPWERHLGKFIGCSHLEEAFQGLFGAEQLIYSKSTRRQDYVIPILEASINRTEELVIQDLFESIHQFNIQVYFFVAATSPNWYQSRASPEPAHYLWQELKNRPSSSTSTRNMLPIGCEAPNLRSSGAKGVLVCYADQGAGRTHGVRRNVPRMY